jgi:hypothetical protein
MQTAFSCTEIPHMPLFVLTGARLLINEFLQSFKNMIFKLLGWFPEGGARLTENFQLHFV